MSIVKKADVEELLKCSITEEMFQRALKCAKHKQEYIYSREKREVVMQDWYLAQLTYEYVISLSFQDFTMELCRVEADMEKEHQVIDQGALTANHIVPAFSV